MDAILLAACCLTGDGTSSTIYNDQRQRQGEIRQSAPDRYDLYDKNWNRQGYGRVSPYNPNAIELFDKKSHRLGEIRTSPGSRGSRSR